MKTASLQAVRSPRPGRGSTRSTGREIRVLVWLARHPGVLTTALVLAGAVLALGPVPTSITVGGLLLAGVVWWRAHPSSFDRWVAPRVRATWRRFTAYRGRRWRDTLVDCELTREHRRTGETLVPRVLRVRSWTPSIDTLYVRMVRGQDVKTFTDRAETLAHALLAHRVAIIKKRPGVLAVVVERRMPFDRVIPAPEIPTDPADVDLAALDVGDNEHGEAFLLQIRGKHVLTVGESGAGKGSLLWGPLRAMGPLIRHRLVRIWMIDLKGGTETDRGAPLFHRWAINGTQAVQLLTEFRDTMRARQQHMRANKIRQATMSLETPYEILMIDELAMLTAYGDRTEIREALRLLGEIMTQGRAGLFSVLGYVQEPTKDIVDVRELFTLRICLGVTAASHVDMALGDGARERGALADEIPGDPAHAGIGFVIDKTTRLPIRFRAAYVTDDEIDELVTRCTPTPDPAITAQLDVIDGEVLDFPTNDSDFDDHDSTDEGVA